MQTSTVKSALSHHHTSPFPILHPTSPPCLTIPIWTLLHSSLLPTLILPPYTPPSSSLHPTLILPPYTPPSSSLPPPHPHPPSLHSSSLLPTLILPPYTPPSSSLLPRCWSVLSSWTCLTTDSSRWKGWRHSCQCPHSMSASTSSLSRLTSAD